MKAAMLGLLAETPVHPGTGRSVGVIDLPVAREAATDYPVIVSSSLKGALRDKAETLHLDCVGECFGSPDGAGSLLVSEARLLLLPVRSLTGAYRWVTCPHLVERYRRDLRRAGQDPQPDIPAVTRGNALAREDAGGQLYLEERQFEVIGKVPPALPQSVAPLLLHEDVRGRLAEAVAVLHDDDFAWFARYGLSVQARNVLEDGTKKSINLWYEETLPPDSVMYAVTMHRSEAAATLLRRLFPDSDPYLQVGGNETVGQGWFAVNVRGDAQEVGA